jgi:hypothetical protein
VAIGGFLAGYSGKTFEAYGLDLRQWSQWCLDHDLDLFEVRRAHIELFARWLEETGRAKSTVARRLSTITGFYRYCTEEQLITHSPGGACETTQGVLRVEPDAAGPKRGGNVLGPSRYQWWPRPRPGMLVGVERSCGSQKRSAQTSNIWEWYEGIAP